MIRSPLWSLRLALSGLALLPFAGSPAAAWAQAPFTSVIPGAKVGGSSNVRVLGHLTLDSAYKTADITLEQELSRPYVYVSHRLVPSGVEIVSIKDPSKPKLLWYWTIENAGLHTSKVVKAARPALAKLGIYLYYLPAYSPELNAIEPVFRQVNYQEMPQRSFTSKKSD